jgi:hypothetical protein
MNAEISTTTTEDLIIIGELTTEDIELNAYLDYRGPKGDTGAQGEQGIQGPKGDAFTYSDFTVEQLASLKGPQGEQGPKGDTGPQGEQGPKGDTGAKGEDGTGVTILGSYNSLEELETAQPTGNLGESYLVDGYLYVWNELNSNWKNVGKIQGPKGDTGPQGEQGPKGEDGKSIDGDTLPIGAIVDFDGDIVPEGYEEVNDGCNNIYSTEETVIGTWIDGSPVYRKVFAVGGSTSQVISIPANANVVNIYGFVKYILMFEPLWTNHGEDGFTTIIDRYGIDVSLGEKEATGSGYLVIEYVKT